MGDELIGRVISQRYRVDSRVASGGMGTIYRVLDFKRNVPLAMKVLHPKLTYDTGSLQRFQSEAGALQEFEHKNIVPFYGVFQADGIAFLLEKFIAGGTLKDKLKEQPGQRFTIHQTLSVQKALCSALGYLHAHNFVHCDVKPANIMLDVDGNIFLTDFGIARHVNNRDAALHHAGTPTYMSPEQIRGQPVTPASDIYSLGVVLFELLTGRLPFLGTEAGLERGGPTTRDRLKYAHLNLDPPDPRRFNPSIPPDLSNSLRTALVKHPAYRYRNAQEFFQSFFNASGIPAHQVTDQVVSEPSNISVQTGVENQQAQTTVEPEKRFLLVSFSKKALLITIISSLVVFVLAGTLFLSRYFPPPLPTTKPTYYPFEVFSVDQWGGSRYGYPEKELGDWTDEVDGPGNYRWETSFPYGTPALLSTGWCASDQNTLVQNWSHMEFELEVDGYKIDISSFTFDRRVESGGVCYALSGVVDGLDKGMHSYKWTQRINRSINDGRENYPPGEYIYEFELEVK